MDSALNSATDANSSTNSSHDTSLGINKDYGMQYFKRKYHFIT